MPERLKFCPILTMIFLLALLVQWTGQLHGQGAELDGFILTVKLADQQAEVSGLYFFKNTGDEKVEAQILLPIATNNTERDVKVVEVTRLNRRESAPFNIIKNGLRFNIWLSPGEDASYRVKYYQKLTGYRYLYLLKNLSLWEKPIRFAGFNVSVPLEGKVTYCSFPEGKVTEGQHTRDYSWSFRNFSPKEDLVVEFNVNE